MRLWRLSVAKYAEAAFTGEGSRLFEARWHRAGLRVVYTASSLALASVEFFVNLDPFIEPVSLVSIEAQLPDELQTERVDAASLPQSWRSPRNLACQQIGSDWLLRKSSVALFVPSAAVLGDWNVLLNPGHTDFAQVRIGVPAEFRYDSRMFRHA